MYDVITLAQLGGSDCEAIQTGQYVVQVVNAYSSLAYVLVGVWLAWRSRGRARLGLLTEPVFGAILIGVGLGSFAFHGPQPVGARWLHDFPIALALLFILLLDLAELRVLRRWAIPVVSAVAAIILAVTMALFIEIGVVLAAPVAVAVLGIEVWTYRRSARVGGTPRKGSRYLVVLALLALGGTLNVLGRTDGPLCDPSSLVQFHGIWHIATALAFGTWSTIAFPRCQPEASRELRHSPPRSTVDKRSSE